MEVKLRSAYDAIKLNYHITEAEPLSSNKHILTLGISVSVMMYHYSNPVLNGSTKSYDGL
jgi:hypothetical protein